MKSRSWVCFFCGRYLEGIDTEIPYIMHFGICSDCMNEVDSEAAGGGNSIYGADEWYEETE